MSHVGGWSGRAPVWAEFVCDTCAKRGQGCWVTADRVPRARMMQRDRKAGWLFEGQHMWCSARCKQEQSKELKHGREGQDRLDKPEGVG